MARISFDNGASFLETDDLSIYRDLINLSWNFIEVYMNDSIREAVCRDCAPCTRVRFLTEYLNRAEDDLILP